jgi:hypothetical protein
VFLGCSIFQRVEQKGLGEREVKGWWVGERTSERKQAVE